MAATAPDPCQAIGRSPEELSVRERLAFAGKYVALEIYSPEKLPLRRIAAIGETLTECVHSLQNQGLDPRLFEFTRLTPPY